MSNGTERTLPGWLMQIIAGIAVACGTWLFATNRMDGVQEQRIATVEKALESKASKESVEGIEKRLERIDGKLDRLLERK